VQNTADSFEEKTAPETPSKAFRHHGNRPELRFVACPAARKGVHMLPRQRQGDSAVRHSRRRRGNCCGDDSGGRPDPGRRPEVGAAAERDCGRGPCRPMHDHLRRGRRAGRLRSRLRACGPWTGRGRPVEGKARSAPSARHAPAGARLTRCDRGAGWAVPIGLVLRPQRRGVVVVCWTFYPSPAGVIESTVDPRAWGARWWSDKARTSDDLEADN